MVRKVCENVERKRELLYSFSTVVFTPILYYFVSSAFNHSPVGLGSSPVLPGGGKEDAGGGGQGGAGGDAGILGEDTTEEGEKGQGAGTEGPLGNLSSVDGDIIDYISKRRELPFEAVLYIVLLELVKLFVVFTVYPGVHLFDQSPSLMSLWKVPGSAGGSGATAAANSAGGNGGRSSQGRLPFSKRDRDNVFVKSPPFHKKILEFWKGLCNYVCSCAVCHLFVVLLGAPIVNDFKVTLQFSVILTTWIFGPMCLAVQPSRLLQELVFISAWNSDNEILFRTKWRFAVTVFGAWVGAIVMPLDWDRPWQIWPVPCLVSTTFAFHITHLVLTFHLFFTVFEVYHRICSTSSESNKIKNF